MPGMRVSTVLRHWQPAISASPIRSSFGRTWSISRYSTAPRSMSTTCSSCSTPLPSSPTAVCPTCSSLQPPPTSSTPHYALFSLRPTFALDQRTLKNSFLKWQQSVHPDLYSAAGREAQEEGANDNLERAKLWSRRINDAFRCLEGNRSRGEYLLSLHGITIGEADGVTDPELLMSIMETREELDEATTEEEVAQIRSRNQQNIKETLERLTTAFDKTVPPDLETAKNLVIQLRYLDNVEGVCREWSPGKRIELQH